MLLVKKIFIVRLENLSDVRAENPKNHIFFGTYRKYNMSTNYNMAILTCGIFVSIRKKKCGIVNIFITNTFLRFFVRIREH